MEHDLTEHDLTEHTILLERAERVTATWKDYLPHTSKEYDTLLREEDFWSSSTNHTYAACQYWHALGNA